MQTPKQEIAKRVGDYAPGLVTAAHVSALNNLRQIQAASRRQLRTDYALQTKLLGGEAGEMPDEEMGNLIVTGDIYGSDADKIVKSLTTETTTTTTTTPSPAPEQPSTGSRLATAALIAAGLLGAGGLGAVIPWLAGAYKGGDTTIVNPSDREQLNVEVIPGGASQQ